MTTEIWKSIKGKEGYEVSNLGRVRHIHYLTPKLQGINHLSVAFTVNNVMEHVQVRRVVAETFIQPLEKDTVVINKDGNIWNNNVDNLSVCQPNSCELSDNLPNEIWKPVPKFEGKYEISNMGRVRSLTRIVDSPTGKRKPFLRYGKVLKPNFNKLHKVSYVNLSNSVVHQYFAVNVAKWVAKLFVENPYHYKSIKFIDGNPKNTRAENLRYVPAPNQPKLATIRKIQKMYINGATMMNIAKETKTSISYIHTMCKDLTKKPNPLEVQGVELYKAGMRQAYIAQILGVKPSTVMTWCKKAGVKVSNN